MDEKKLPTDDRLILEDLSGESVHVPTTAFAEFEAKIAASLEQLVAAWSHLASPQATSRSASWRR